MEELINDILEASQAEADPEATDADFTVYGKKILEKISDVDAILFDVNPVAAIEERGLTGALGHLVPNCFFLKYLLESMNAEHLLFYLEAEYYRTHVLTETVDHGKWRTAAQEIHDLYILPNSLLEINVISPVRDAVRSALNSDAGERLQTIFEDCCKACIVLLQDTWKQFVQCPLYLQMMSQLSDSSMSTSKRKVEAIRLLLNHFRSKNNNPSELVSQEAAKMSQVVHERTLLFLRRNNTYNNIELDPDHILQNWYRQASNDDDNDVDEHAAIVRVTKPYVPNAYDSTAVSLNVGDLIVVENQSATGIWVGKLHGRGQPITFPFTHVEQTDLKTIDSASETPLLAIFKQFSSRMVQSSTQLIANSHPPIASWMLEGIVGVVLGSCQLISTADGICHRAFLHRDVRSIQHRSVELLEHFQGLDAAVKKAYGKNNDRMRRANPNYLNSASAVQILGIINDLLVSYKECMTTVVPVVSSFSNDPTECDMGQYMSVIADRKTLMEPRLSIESAMTFLQRSTNTLTSATKNVDDLSFFLRSMLLIFIGCLQLTEMVINSTQNNVNLAPKVDELLSQLSKQLTIFNEYGMKVAMKVSVRDHLAKTEQSANAVLAAAQSLVDAIAKTTNVREVSTAELEVEQTDSESVEDTTKDMVAAISTFIQAVNSERKTEYIGLSDEICQTTTRLGNKIAFEMTNIGVTGIIKFQNLISDGSDLVAHGSKGSQSSSSTSASKKVDSVAVYQSLTQNLAKAVMAMLPSADVEFSLAKHVSANQQVMQILKDLRDLAYRVSDRATSTQIRFDLKRVTSTMAADMDRLQLAARETSGIVVNQDAMANLRAACATALATTKQLGELLTVAAAEEEPDTSRFSQMRVNTSPVSAFDTSGSGQKPLSPFDSRSSSDRPVSVVLERPSAAAQKLRRPMSTMPTRNSMQVDSDGMNPLKKELNSSLLVMQENVSKIRNDANLAAGVWPPPNVIDEIKIACQNVAKAVKSVLSCYELLTNSERDRLERETSVIVARWKQHRLQLHGFIIEYFGELGKFHEKKQQDLINDRHQTLRERADKHKIPSKVWLEKASNTDYEKWYPALCTEEILKDSNADIIFEKNSDQTRFAAVKAASLDALVRILTHYGQPDPLFTRSFLLTYRTFTTPVELLQLLFDRYAVGPPPSLTNTKQIEYYYVKKIVPIRLRVMNVIKTWLEERYDEFSEQDFKLQKLLIEFIDSEMLVTDDNLAQLLRKTITKKMDAKEDKAAAVVTKEEGPSTIYCANWFGNETPIYDIDPLEIARQLTLIDFQIFSSIKAGECLNQAWSKAALKDRSPNIRAMIKRSNDLTYFVATEILLKEDLETRQKYLGHFILAAQKCLELNNFNGVLAIYSGLSSSPIHRLKRTWEYLEAKSNQQVKAAWSRLEALTDSANNHQSYRSALHSINPPCVPFLGLYLTDLVFIDDGNANTLEVRNNVYINYNKRFATYSAIAELQQFQQKAYSLNYWSQLAKYLTRNEHLLDDNQMYKQSLKVEPRT